MRGNTNTGYHHQLTIPSSTAATSTSASQDDFSAFIAALAELAPSFPPPPPLSPMPYRKKRKGEVTEPVPEHVPAAAAADEILPLSSSPDIKAAIATLVSSLMLDPVGGQFDHLQQPEPVQTNLAKSCSATANYLSQLNDNLSQTLTETNRVRAKRARLAVSAVSTAAVAAAEDEDAQNQIDEQLDADQLVVVDGKQQAQPKMQRRLWVKDRSRAWWEACCSPDFPDAEFRREFRMGKATFDMICEELAGAVAKEDTMLRAAIPVRQRVAVCIWRLATGEPLRLVSKRFGLGISTCHKLVLEVCAAIKTRLMPKFLQWPDTARAAAICGEFEAASGIPGVVGSMYTTHVPIIAPKVSVAAYFNRRHTERNQKTSYSITLQAVADPAGVFTDVCIGYPGSMSDDKILEQSMLYQRGQAGQLAGSWVVGGSGYPLMDWLLAPYTQQHLTWTQHAFNEKVTDVRRVAASAFARLKGRWACLQKRTEVKLQDLPVVLMACCVLHNICELRGEVMEPEWAYTLVDDEMVPEGGAIRSNASLLARDSIAHNLLHHGLAGTAFV